ncbi:hypothetical protein OG799_23350 [Micromonospora sp. NBC_00898]|uniref:hypothetical protein n=1 Tax=Micromonospora sp. NBC_00898 TaxID=2975981 RepID=UPI00386C10C9|nr:hypothetical protein OG799_23350 [Micromonospora sp. NBC_00898]
MTSAADGEQHDGAVVPSSAPRRSHGAWAWFLLILAQPGAGWSLYVAVVASAPFFGEQPSPTDRATTTAAVLSGASLWLATALLTAVVFRRAVVPVLCGLAAAGFAALALPGRQPRAPLSAADSAGWLSAWAPPTSWVIALWGVSTLVLSTYGQVRAALGGRVHRAAPRHTTGVTGT